MDIHTFLQQDSPILDARSPSEFNHGHIPGAFSLPLFSDEERKIVGTIYKQEGKEPAVKKGLFFVGPKLLSFVEKAEEIAGQKKILRLYCARGGMRSSSLAWLLQTAGFNCILLDKGYKSFRNWALAQFHQKYPFLVLGGFTGTGKTKLLHMLQNKKKQIIDLEDIAKHKGSSFGDLEGFSQPSSEHFENILAMKLAQLDPNCSVWIEDESRTIGSCYLPEGIWTQMRGAPFLWIEKSKEKRVSHLLSSYGNYHLEDLLKATKKLSKKLGAVKVLEIGSKIQNGDLESAISTVLEYYDKAYAYSCQKNPRNRINIPAKETDDALIEELLSAFSTNLT